MIAPERRPHSINPRSGRPEAPISWRTETFWNWSQAVAALGGVVVGMFAAQNDFRIGAAFFAIAALIGIVAYNGARSLQSRKIELELAEEAYDQMLARH